MRNFKRRGRTVLLATLALIAGGCGGSAPLQDGARSRTHAVLINGGGARWMNYQSHMLHVQDLLEILRSSGVAADDITIFSSDGDDPEGDLAVREPAKERGLWRLSGTRLARLLRPVRYESSTIPGFALHAATREEISNWFLEHGADLPAGDTLFLYVTDHGDKNPKNTQNNSITLWGKGEELSVAYLRELLGELNPDVRVVMVMSQCFSGSFAGLAFPKEGMPTGNVCGFFSSTAKRPAYGCYAENLGRKNVGHSFHFMQALVETGRFDQAHEKVVYTDATPDVPLRTSEVFLRRLLVAAANSADVPFADFVDRQLKIAWEDRGAWEPEIRQLDRIGHAFGYFSPRSLQELNEQAAGLVDIRNHLESVAGAWSATLTDVNATAIRNLLEHDPIWTERLSPEGLEKLDAEQLETLALELLRDLTRYTKADPALEERLQVIHQRQVAAAAASYRMEVRRAAVIRLRNQLVDVAGRVYLASSGSPEEREAYAALRACEGFSLPIGDPERTELVPPQAFPPFEEDLAAATAALPAWLGVRFRTVSSEDVEQLGIEKGAAVVLAVIPDSAAERAGMEAGDIILGPPGAPFTEANELRGWVMLSEAGKARTVEVVREGTTRRVTLIPDPFPAKFPELPGPPKVGTVAPPLRLTAYRGEVAALGDGKPHLLVFWATWCAPCKAALPELEAFAAKTGTDLIGITDQTRDALDKFFNDGGEYVDNIAMDDYRRTFLTYGVSGTPTFVLVDGDGKVASYTTGYSLENGLGIDGWKWEPPAGP